MVLYHDKRLSPSDCDRSRVDDPNRLWRLYKDNDEESPYT